MSRTPFRLGQLSRPVTAACLTALLVPAAPAQDAPANGMRERELRVHAITDATVVVRPGESVEHATIVIRDGVIIAVGTDVAVPNDARVWPGEGLTVYPGLIDAAVLVNTDAFEKGPGGHWNAIITPELNVADVDAPAAALRKSLRESGFTTAAVFPEEGVFRGTGVVASMSEQDDDVVIYDPRSFMAAGFDRTRGYPGSLMGSIALSRQTLSDTMWHQKALHVWQEHPEVNEPPLRADSLVALQDVVNGSQSVLFQVTDEQNLLRADKVMREFGLDCVFLGSGREFLRLDEIVACDRPIIVPVNFASRPDVSSLSSADNVSLRQMMIWELSPTNPHRLVEAGVTIALTTNGLDSPDKLFGALHTAMINGLTEEQALAALTTTPATLLGIDHLVGSIEPGKIANLVVVDGSLLDKKPKIRDTWVDGRRHEISSAPENTFVGSATLRMEMGDGFFTADARIDTEKPSVSITNDEGETTKAKKVQFQGKRLLFLIDGVAIDSTGYAQASATLSDGAFIGTMSLADGTRTPFTLVPSDEPLDAVEDEEDNEGENRPRRASRNEAAAEDDDGLSGEWDAVIETEMMPEPLEAALKLTLGESGDVTGTLVTDFFNADITGSFDDGSGDLSLTISSDMGDSAFTGTVADKSLTGNATSEEFSYRLSASRAVGGGDEESDENGADVPAPEYMLYPLGAYGLTEPPVAQDAIFVNATLWTQGPAGLIENGELEVRDGRIAYAGPARPAPGARGIPVIDLDGKHITPGLIDCHSHTGVSGGVNEMGGVNTAEVRIGDVVNPDDINWYRQLAGGLTAVNQLHGSANPIGGQNSVVKIKWGGSAEDYRIEDAIPGIKFALGENVKRAPDRYPNTRMGVETVIRDAFIAAREYQRDWDRYLNLPASDRDRTIPPRRDMELDTLVEILEGQRIVHCHSYRQDEVLMLIRVAEEFGFTIGTFQHILEGYKVAEAISAHGAGASTFSDWWAYKVEAMDAIPYNGALLHEIGITVSFNSDSSELARRMNSEAAKAVRYGGLKPTDALSFVTINPARQLRVDHRIGSLEVGKDADFAVWSDDPLSTYAICEQTWIEGARYFSLEQDRELRGQVQAERRRLIQKILSQAHGQTKSASDEDKAMEPEEHDSNGFSVDVPFTADSTGRTDR